MKRMDLIFNIFFSKLFLLFKLTGKGICRLFSQNYKECGESDLLYIIVCVLLCFVLFFIMGYILKKSGISFLLKHIFIFPDFSHSEKDTAGQFPQFS